MTRAVAVKLSDDLAFAEFVTESLGRHVNGDWGELSEEDTQENEFSLEHGLRLLSAYVRDGMPKLWVVTEADRSVTTVLFPEEY